jgi:hypothetical protein
MRFELWTSGEFAPDALAKLQFEKARRTNATIDWKDGAQVRELSQRNRDSAVTKAIDEHFFKHPLARAAAKAKNAGLNQPLIIAGGTNAMVPSPRVPG